jgi:hypothetical protein
MGEVGRRDRSASDGKNPLTSPHARPISRASLIDSGDHQSISLDPQAQANARGAAIQVREPSGVLS